MLEKNGAAYVGSLEGEISEKRGGICRELRRSGIGRHRGRNGRMNAQMHSAGDKGVRCGAYMEVKMGFLQKLFRKRQQNHENDEDWEEIIYARDKVNFYDKEQRDRYVTNCLEQITEASRELELLAGEYNLVTSYLTDMDEIEALPEEEKEGLEGIARKLKALEQERRDYQGKKNRMSDGDYYQMRKQENEIEEGIAKLKEAEDYSVLVRQDLQRLNGERHAYEYRRQELEGMLTNLKGMAVIFLTALGVCLAMLAVLQFGLGMNTYVGYFLSIVAGAIAIMVVCVKYTNADRELIRVENTNNKLIQLQNKVKIRYVNNHNLLEYYYMKYNTDSCAALAKRWKQYQQEKEERKQYAEAEAKIEYYQKQLVSDLGRFRVRTPERWINQSNALLDKRDMVEIRHELIMRRQALRKQLDYNQNVAKTAKSEIADVVAGFPQFSEEINGIVDRYERELVR